MLDLSYSLCEHGFIVILQPIRRHDNGQELPVNLSDELLFLLLGPRPVTLVSVEDADGLIVVDRVEGDGSLELALLDVFVLG